MWSFPSVEMGREIEKKFIIVKPSSFPEGTVASRIEQYFLLPRDGYDTRRIRARTTAGKTVYTYTEKRLLSGFTRIENERGAVIGCIGYNRFKQHIVRFAKSVEG